MAYNAIIASKPSEFDAAKSLFRAYADTLDFDLGFQNFEQELAEIAVQYGLPSGGLILLATETDYIGCVGVRRFDTDIAELKRMYIKNEYRGQGLGKLLLTASLGLAKNLGYQKLRLDTIDTMEAAIKLYESFGFYTIDPYRHNPVEGVQYFEKKLT